MLRHRWFDWFAALTVMTVGSGIVACATPAQADVSAMTQTVIAKEQAEPKCRERVVTWAGGPTSPLSRRVIDERFVCRWSE